MSAGEPRLWQESPLRAWHWLLPALFAATLQISLDLCTHPVERRGSSNFLRKLLIPVSMKADVPRITGFKPGGGGLCCVDEAAASQMAET